MFAIQNQLNARQGIEPQRPNIVLRIGGHFQFVRFMHRHVGQGQCPKLIIAHTSSDDWGPFTPGMQYIT